MVETDTRFDNNIYMTVDVAVVDPNWIEVLLIKRAIPPFMDRYALPGGHLDLTDQNAAAAAARELLEETGLDADPRSLQLTMLLDEIDRDPRPGRRISAAFILSSDRLRTSAPAKAGSDAKSLHWVKLASIRPEDMAFDHYKAIEWLINNR